MRATYYPIKYFSLRRAKLSHQFFQVCFWNVRGDVRHFTYLLIVVFV